MVEINFIKKYSKEKIAITSYQYTMCANLAADLQQTYKYSMKVVCAVLGSVMACGSSCYFQPDVIQNVGGYFGLSKTNNKHLTNASEAVKASGANKANDINDAVVKLMSHILTQKNVKNTNGKTDGKENSHIIVAKCYAHMLYESFGGGSYHDLEFSYDFYDNNGKNSLNLLSGDKTKGNNVKNWVFGSAHNSKSADEKKIIKTTPPKQTLPVSISSNASSVSTSSATSVSTTTSSQPVTATENGITLTTFNDYVKNPPQGYNNFNKRGDYNIVIWRYKYFPQKKEVINVVFEADTLKIIGYGFEYDKQHEKSLENVITWGGNNWLKKSNDYHKGHSKFNVEYYKSKNYQISALEGKKVGDTGTIICYRGGPYLWHYGGPNNLGGWSKGCNCIGSEMNYETGDRIWSSSKGWATANILSTTELNASWWKFCMANIIDHMNGNKTVRYKIIETKDIKPEFEQNTSYTSTTTYNDPYSHLDDFASNSEEDEAMLREQEQKRIEEEGENPSMLTDSVQADNVGDASYNPFDTNTYGEGYVDMDSLEFYMEEVDVFKKDKSNNNDANSTTYSSNDQVRDDYELPPILTQKFDSNIIKTETSVPGSESDKPEKYVEVNGEKIETDTEGTNFMNQMYAV